jgi:hypothetical protein
MDLTVDPQRPASGAIYLEHLNRLIALGARKILFFGLTHRAAELLPRLDAYSGSFKLDLAICDHRVGTPALAGVQARCLGPDAALRENWDAIVSSEPAATVGTFAFADAIAENASAYPHVIYAGKRARAVLAVSLPKCGTHLVSRVMARLGYDVHVPPKVPADIWPSLQLDPLEMPDNCCYVPPGLFLSRQSDKSVKKWHDNKDPAVVFCHRDPRDALVSLVHYLMNEAKEPFTPIQVNVVHSAILKSLPTAEARLMHAIEDETFPFRGVFASHAWMLRHPLVHTTTFDRLVGAAGGGSDEQQVAAVRAMMRHIGANGDPAEVATAVFDRSQRTFFRGQIGAFRREFSAAHLAAFNRHFREVTVRYGYDPDAALEPSTGRAADPSPRPSRS